VAYVVEPSKYNPRASVVGLFPCRVTVCVSDVKLPAGVKVQEAMSVSAGAVQVGPAPATNPVGQ
jgi:hypothetical protein